MRGIIAGVIMLVVSWLGSSCATICPKTWETGVEVGHSVFFGASVTTHATVGGDIGDECLPASK